MFRRYFYDHEYESERKGRMKAQDNSRHYRNKYLELRKQIRDWSRAEGIELPDELKKAVGINPKKG